MFWDEYGLTKNVKPNNLPVWTKKNQECLLFSRRFAHKRKTI